ncbi:MAG: hypothetical protein IKU82_05365, partial [Clostridia bacterium]|nr:hypothetical protein [Clostridia bacterium]
MSEQFNDKDYGEYFSALQKSIENKSKPVNEQHESVKLPQKRKQKTIRLRPWVYVAMGLTSVFLVICITLIIVLPPIIKAHNESKSQTHQTENTTNDLVKVENRFAKFTEHTDPIASDIESGCIIVINCDTNEVIASRNATVRCYPASTTKIMTILTAVDYITDYNETFTFSFKITDPLYLAEATVAGFSNGESVNMTDMLYGAILPSGADATVGLALSIAGSEEEFVKL